MLCCALAAYLTAQLGAAFSLVLATLFPSLRDRLMAEPAFSAAAWRPGMDEAVPARPWSGGRRCMLAMVGILVAVISVGGLIQSIGELTRHGLEEHPLGVTDGYAALICSGTND